MITIAESKIDIVDSCWLYIIESPMHHQQLQGQIR